MSGMTRFSRHDRALARILGFTGAIFQEKCPGGMSYRVVLGVIGTLFFFELPDVVGSDPYRIADFKGRQVTFLDQSFDRSAGNIPFTGQFIDPEGWLSLIAFVIAHLITITGHF